MSNTTNQASQTPPSLLIEGLLFDSVANQPVNYSAIEFCSRNEKISVDTDPEGRFSIQLPHRGNWTIEPDKHKYPSHYFFAPATITVSRTGDVGQIPVQGDNVANAQMLETFVGNVFVAAQNLFAEAMKKYDPKTLTQTEVQTEAGRVFKIVSNGLHSVIKDITENHLLINQSQAEPLCEQTISQQDEQSTLAAAGAVCCGYCYTRYASNPTLLQQCLCCPTPCKNC